MKVGDRTFVQNRRHLIKSEDKFVEDTQEVEETHAKSSETPPTGEPPQEASLPLQSGPATALMSTPDRPWTSSRSPGRRVPISPPEELRRSSRSTQGKRPDYLGNLVYYKHFGEHTNVLFVCCTCFSQSFVFVVCIKGEM